MKKTAALLVIILAFIFSITGCGEEKSYIEDGGVLGQYYDQIVSGKVIKDMLESYSSENEFDEARYAVRDILSEAQLTTSLGKKCLDACHELFEMQAAYCKKHWDEKENADLVENMKEELEKYYKECDELSEEFSDKVDNEYKQLDKELYE